MLHNKYFEILESFLGDYTKEIYGRGLVGKVSLSQKGIALALDDLEKQNILKSRKEGNMKYFHLNKDNSEMQDILITLELARKIEFLNKHRKLAHIFKQDDRIVGIFGSYAKGIHRSDSDIDIFVVAKRRKNDYEEQGKLVDLEISVKYFSEQEFKNLLKEKNNLLKEVVANHIIIFGVEKFIELVWRVYHGFD